MNDVLIATSLTLFMLQPTIIQSVLDTLSCQDFSLDKSFISKDLIVQCYTNDYIKWILISQSLLNKFNNKCKKLSDLIDL